MKKVSFYLNNLSTKEGKSIQIKTYGNVFTNICFLEGISMEEITREELDYYDKYFPLIVCVRGAK